MAEDDTQHSLMLTRSCLHSRQGILIKKDSGTALTILLLDRSGSMHEFGQVPRKAANECIQTVQKAPGAENTAFALFTFGNEVSLDIQPQPIKSVGQLTGYTADGGTKLYEAVYVALYAALEFHGVADSQGKRVEVAISVISDGQDTASDPKYLEQMRELSHQARQRGFKLQVIGIGVDSTRLAQDLGFEEGLAHTLDPTDEGVRQAAEESSVLFSISALHSIVT